MCVQPKLLPFIHSDFVSPVRSVISIDAVQFGMDVIRLSGLRTYHTIHGTTEMADGSGPIQPAASPVSPAILHFQISASIPPTACLDDGLCLCDNTDVMCAHELYLKKHILLVFTEALLLRSGH